MEGLIQRTSSQTKQLDQNSKLGVDKLKTSKPPLLPKPQTVKPHQKNAAVNNSSPKIVIKQEVVGGGAISPVSNGDRVSLKPPPISPKPQLPPKSVALNSLKSEVLPSILVERPADPKLSQTSALRPPISPQKNINVCDSEAYTLKKGLFESSVTPKSLILSRKSSDSLTRNESPNWSIKDLIKDQEQLSEFCKQVENCSKHSHILREGLSPQLSPYQWQKKLQDELLLSNSISETDSANLTEAHSSNCVLNSQPLGYVNGCEGSLLQDQNSDRRSEESSSDVPKSFLHKYISTCNQAKEPVKCDDEEKESINVQEKNVNVQSFLHKSRTETPPKLSKSRSLGQHDSLPNEDGTCASLPCKLNDKSPGTNGSPSVKADSFKKSGDSSDRPSSSEINSFSKRFPWFGSFGKGGKKDSVKKGRCLSQFYATSTVVDEQILREKNRTKSLPDIKQTRIVPEELKTEGDGDGRGMLRISGEFPHSDSDDDKDSLNQVEFTSEKDPKTLAYLKARELMTSEEVFIDVLKLLNVDFRNYVQFKNFESKNSCIPNSEVNKILNHLSQLQVLNEDILEDLKKRIENWESNPKIADVIVKKGAFLKMYTTYIQNFESQTNYLDECVNKYPKFGKMVKEFEATDRCKKLTIKHYMLKPVQRIPQYRLLLNDYLKYLNESSEDYADTLSALKIVCEVVDHANRKLTHGDKEGRLMHFQSLLSDFELIRPGRELIKDGPLEKICRKTVRDRYFILLNDCLLHTTYSKQYLKIHQQLPLSGMKICYTDDEKYPLSFTVHSITKSFILCAKSEAECKEWVETLQKTIEEHIKRQKTFLNVKIEEDSSFKLGKEAPVWVQDGKVTMCQICTAEFTALFRRHHCRGCGKVVCRNCGSNQAPLQYRNFKPDRVCDQCFDLLLKDYEDSEESICEILKGMLNLNDDSTQNEYLIVKARFIRYTSANSLKKQKYIPPRLKEVSANDSKSVISGWLHRKSRKSWKPFWYVLKDHVLYVYKASEDVLALETIPVLGYEVERANVYYEDVDKNLVFSLVHPRQAPITFRAESQTAADRWFYALTAAASLDHLPP